MADVINKTTLKYLRSVNTPDYPSSEWIINPSLPNCESKYWKISGNNVIEMTTNEKKTVDNNIIAQELEGVKASKENELKSKVNDIQIKSESYYQTKKVEIDDATTVEEVEQIDI